MKNHQSDKLNGHIYGSFYFVTEIGVHYILSKSSCIFIEEEIIKYYYFCQEDFSAGIKYFISPLKVIKVQKEVA